MRHVWQLPLRLAWGVALAQRAVLELIRGIRNVDVAAAAELNRRLAEQWAWEMMSPLLRASAEVTEQQDMLDLLD